MSISAATILATVSLGQCQTYSADSVGAINCGAFGYPPALGLAISPHGSIAGYYHNCEVENRAFHWPSGGVFTPIVFAENINYARSFDISASGLVVGDVQVVGVFGHRAFQSIGGVTTYLPPLPGHNWSEAHGVNSSGVVCGVSAVNHLIAVVWQNQSPSAMALPLGPKSTAEDINDQSQICGWMGVDPWPEFGASPFIWHKGVTSTLPLPVNAMNNSGAAIAINNLGDACGVYYLDNTGSNPAIITRGCAWLGGQVIDLGTLPGCNETHPKDINDAREIVGYCEPTASGPLVPFLWRNGVMYDLRTLTPPPPVGPTMYTAQGINNKGQITGYGAVPLPVGHGVAFLLTPALPATPGDTDCTGSVNFDDLLDVLNNWNPQGPVGGNPADLDRDNRINIDDLLEVLNHWGCAPARSPRCI